MDEVDWGKIFRFLAEKYSWTFEDISKLTISQLRIALELEDDQKKGIPIGSYSHLKKFVKNLRLERVKS